MNQYHEEEYQGYKISVFTTQVGDVYRWNYQIDGGTIREQFSGGDPSENAVLWVGMGEAKAAIDRMRKPKP